MISGRPLNVLVVSVDDAVADTDAGVFSDVVPDDDPPPTRGPRFVK